MPKLKPITTHGWLKDVNDNFETLQPIISGDGDGLGAFRVARATFDTAVAANKTVAAHGLGVTIPANSIIVGGWVDVLEVPTSGGGATIAVHVKTANDIVTATAISSAPWKDKKPGAIIPKIHTPESTGIKLAGAKEITVTVAAAALTAGKFIVYLVYTEGVETPA